MHCGEPPFDVRAFAEDAYRKLRAVLQKRLADDVSLLYARVDVLPGLRLGELELVEPELFFLDRVSNGPKYEALEKFYNGILARA